MILRFRRAMEVLYWLCILLSGTSLVLISVVIPWGVYTRYVLNRAASWPEPMAILLTIVLTFFGAAACYRAEIHVRVSVLIRLLPALGQEIADFVDEALVALLSLFMLIWGEQLVEATWHQSIADFPSLSVGVTYLPIPMGGFVTLLFALERIALGRPAPALPDPSEVIVPID